MSTSDTTIGRLRAAAKAAPDVDAFLHSAEDELADDIGVCSLWLAVPVGPQRCDIIPRTFDPMVVGLSGMVTDAGHPANSAIATGQPVWADSPMDVRRVAPTHAPMWQSELGASATWAVPARGVALIGVSDRASVLSASNRSRITAAAELAAILHADIARAEHHRAMSALTGRQQLIAHFIARGMTNVQIADELDVSPTTVATDAALALRGLGHESRDDLVAAQATDRLLDEVG